MAFTRLVIVKIADENADNEENIYKYIRTPKKTLLTLWHFHLVSRLLSDREIYEKIKSAFMQVSGLDMNALIQRPGIQQLLELVFPDMYILSHHVDQLVTHIGQTTFYQDAEISWEGIQVWYDRELERKMEQRTKIKGIFLEKMVFNPHSWFSQVWEWGVRLACVYNFIMIPIQFTFERLRSSRGYETITSLEIVVDLLLILNMLFMFNLSYMNKRSKLVTDRGKIMRHYLATSFTADLLASVPFDWIGVGLGVSAEKTSLLRLPKLIRMNKIISYLKKRLATENTMQGAILRHTFVLLALLHTTACIWFLIGTFHEPSWYQPEQEASNSPYYPPYGMQAKSTWAQQYLLSMYWVTATLSTYGVSSEMLPTNYTEIGFTIVLMFINMTLFAYVLGEISRLVMDKDMVLVQMRNRMAAVEQFLQDKCLPKNVQLSIRQYLSTSHSTTAFTIQEAFQNLSHSLAVTCAHRICFEQMQMVPIFSDSSRVLLDELCVLVEETTFGQNEYLYQEEEVALELFFIMRGYVERFVRDGNTNEETQVTLLKRNCSSPAVPFYFGINHTNSARVAKGSHAFAFKLQRAPFLMVMNRFPKEAELVMLNALGGYEKAKSEMSNPHASHISGATTSSATRERADATHRIKKLKENFRNRQTEESCRLAARGNEDALMTLLLNGNGTQSGFVVGVNSQTDRCKRTALHLACSEGQAKVVGTLIALGADTSMQDSFGNNPLNDALRGKHDEVLQLLAKHNPGLKPNLPGHSGPVQLCYAAFQGDLNQLKRLVLHGYNVNGADYDKRTALHLASCEGHIECLKFLLEQGADVGAKDRFGGTPVHDAVRHRRWPCIRLLKKHGGNLLLTEDRAFLSTTMCQAASTGDEEQLFLYMDVGADPNLKDHNGRTALHLAASDDQGRVLLQMLEHYEIITPNTSKHMRPLVLGLMNKPARMALNLNPVDNYGNTPLDDAVRLGNTVAISILQKAGAKSASSEEMLESIQNERREVYMKNREVLLPLVQDLIAGSPEFSLFKEIEEDVLPGMLSSNSLEENARSLTSCIEEILSVLNILKAAIKSCKRIKGQSLVDGLLVIAIREQVSNSDNNAVFSDRALRKSLANVTQRTACCLKELTVTAQLFQRCLFPRYKAAKFALSPLMDRARPLATSTQVLGAITKLLMHTVKSHQS
ncbi:hypothetical protein CYMTET_52125 [Cymbomonas tetramitiformis]|uniref:Cyclic nucleotide-binding domain-containing protein n=1 Tax=Cymbomonas tetramitiformis TaxID=36881 RepID=A0AAE0BJM1_9CHLO|nr:hypothetical protein CYMTET_52125 [Cymbomonas tetramitiformis]